MMLQKIPCPKLVGAIFGPSSRITRNVHQKCRLLSKQVLTEKKCVDAFWKLPPLHKLNDCYFEECFRASFPDGAKGEKRGGI